MNSQEFCLFVNADGTLQLLIVCCVIQAVGLTEQEKTLTVYSRNKKKTFGEVTIHVNLVGEKVYCICLYPSEAMLNLLKLYLGISYIVMYYIQCNLFSIRWMRMKC